MNPNNLVCRTCLGIISEGKIAHNIDDENGIIKNVRNIREMIMFCVPEMDIYVSISPVICESCIGTLVGVYNFKIRCLRVENAIRSYIVANNVLEGSCVNLNNVVRQQIVEALKQKNWPPEFIKQYVDEHLCSSKGPVLSPSVSGEAFRSVTQKSGVPRMPGNTDPRPPPLNFYENPSMAGNIFNLSSAPSPSNYPSPSMEIPVRIDSRPPIQPPVALPGPKYIRVSKNLMPPRPDLPFSPPPYSTSAKKPTPLGSSWEGEFQHSFLNSLQLTNSANGGRQEAVLLNAKPKVLKVKKVQKIKKSTPVLGNLLHAGGQNAVLPMSSKNLTRPLEDPSPQISESVLNPYARVSPTSGIIRNMTEQEINSLRKVRKTPVKTYTKKGLNSAVISIEDDDDTSVSGPIVERIGNNEIMIMNFDEAAIGDNFEIVNGNKEASTVDTNVTTPNTNAEPNFNKTILVKVPMIDEETMKRKLTPEDVIEEIESKRRRLTVKLSNKLPYLHKNKKLVVKLRQDRFFSCRFCKFTALRMKAVKKHYWNHHKVCALCNFKSKQTINMIYHIHLEHREAAEEIIKNKDEKKSEFHCYLCNFTGLSGADLRDHRFRVHLRCDSTGMYQCPVITCTKELAIAYDMIRHIESAHDKTRDTQCPLCNTRASSKYYLGKHLERHRWTRISCQFCGSICKNTQSLETHIKKKHPQTVNFTGMVSASDSTSCNEDFIVTLDNLQSTTSNSQAASNNSAPLNNPRIEDRNLDEYEFALPSLSEMLCAQTLIEEPHDQPGDHAVVSEKDPLPTHKRKSIEKKTKKRPRKQILKKTPVQGDLEDCLIVNQEIETVDVSDEDNHLYTSGADVIEIDDEDEDDNDCVVVETSAQKACELEGTPRDGSETDTCSEISEAARLQTPQGAVSGNTTDSCSELSATDILDGKRACNKGSLVKEKGTLENLPSDALEAANLDKETNTTSSENENHQSIIDGSSESEISESIVAEKMAESTPDADDNAANTKSPCGAVSENITKTCSELSATDILTVKKVCDKSSLVKEKEPHKNMQSASEKSNSEGEKNESTVADKNDALLTPNSDNATKQQTPLKVVSENKTDTCSELSIPDIVASLQKEIDAIGSENKNDQSKEDELCEREGKESTVADKNYEEVTSDSNKSKDNENEEAQIISNKETSQSSEQSDTSKASETGCENASKKVAFIVQTKKNDDQAMLKDKCSESIKNVDENTLEEIQTANQLDSSETKDKGNVVDSENEIIDSEKPMEEIFSETNPESSEHNKLEENRSRTSNENDQTSENNTPSETENKDVTNGKDSQINLASEEVDCQGSLEIDAVGTETNNSEAAANEKDISESDPLSIEKESNSECDKAKLDAVKSAQKPPMDISESDPLSIDKELHRECDAAKLDSVESAQKTPMDISESDPLSIDQESHSECDETLDSVESAQKTSMDISESDPLSIDKETHSECDEAKLDSVENAQKTLMDILEVGNNQDNQSPANISDNPKLDHTSKEKSLEPEPGNDNPDDNFVVLDEI